MDRLNKLTFALDKISSWSLYLLIFCLPFSKSIVEITIVTALLSFVALKLIKRQPLLGRSYIEIALYIFLAANLISLFNTQYFALSLKALFTKSIKFALLFLITKEIINTREKLNNFLAMALLSCAIILIDGFVQNFYLHRDFLHMYPAFKYYPETPYDQTFPTASFPFPNDYAAWILIFIFPVGIYALFVKCGWRNRLGMGAIFIALLCSLILTKARGAWMGFFTTLALIPFLRLKRSLVLLLIIIILFSAVSVNKFLISDILSIVSINDRVVMWKNGWEIFKKHPVIGNGLNTFFAEYKKVRNDSDKNKRGSYAHNCYLQMAADTGLLGLISFLLFVTAVLAAGFKALKIIKDPLYYSLILGISLGLIAFLVHSAGDTNLYSLPLAALFWLSAGILSATVKLAKADT
ncbi:MAG: O-antigen ligase family protein [Candidatus Omnitrophica bacterium]|nr:O-antigen ligase family protein [Candidatus Omnitrophota bacterium]